MNALPARLLGGVRARGMERALPVVAAAAISAGIILADFGRTAIPWSEVVRPILVVSIVALLVGLAATQLMGRLPAAVVTVLLTVGLVRPIPALVIAGGVAVWIGARRAAQRLGWGDGSISEIVPGIAVLGVAFMVVSFAGAVGTLGPPPLGLPGAAQANGGEGDGQGQGQGGESLYVLFLDGYPRGDTLAEDFGYDNEPFLRGLEQRGFEVDRQSETLYPFTHLALAHLLHVDLSDLNVKRRNIALRRAVRPRLDDSPLIADWRSAGYEVTILRNPIGHTVIDGSLDTGQATEFEVALLGRSSIPFLVRDWIIDQQRERLDAGLSTVVRLAQSEGSHVVLAHLLAPHPPFFARPAPACWPNCGLWRSTGLSYTGPDGEYAEAVRNQMDHVNPRVLNAVDAIIQADPSAAIVVFSDHGFRHRPAGDPDWLRSLYAVRGTLPVEFGRLDD